MRHNQGSLLLNFSDRLENIHRSRTRSLSAFSTRNLSHRQKYTGSTPCSWFTTLALSSVRGGYGVTIYSARRSYLGLTGKGINNVLKLAAVAKMTTGEVSAPERYGA